MSNKKAVSKYRKTKKGVATTIYCSQKQTSAKRGYQPPEYTKQQFSDWLLNHPKFDSIYTDWVESGYKRWKKPSVDRLDDYKPYSFNNIRLVTWEDNHIKHNKDVINCINQKCFRPVIQFDKKDNQVKKYCSIKQAARELNILANGIRKCCIGEYKTSGGYIWRYDNVTD